MRLFAITVNFFFLLHRLFRSGPNYRFFNRFIGEANYSKAAPWLARSFAKRSDGDATPPVRLAQPACRLF
jgi:hypothetical protein